jgi:hypothetical protein
MQVYHQYNCHLRENIIGKKEMKGLNFTNAMEYSRAINTRDGTEGIITNEFLGGKRNITILSSSLSLHENASDTSNLYEKC